MSLSPYLVYRTTWLLFITLMFAVTIVLNLWNLAIAPIVNAPLMNWQIPSIATIAAIVLLLVDALGRLVARNAEPDQENYAEELTEELKGYTKNGGN